MASVAGCRKCDLSEPGFRLASLDNIVYLSAQACQPLGVGVIHGSSQAPMTDALGSMSNVLKGSLEKKRKIALVFHLSLPSRNTSGDMQRKVDECQRVVVACQAALEANRHEYTSEHLMLKLLWDNKQVMKSMETKEK